MSRKKETKAEMDRHTWLMDYCRDCMAGLIECGMNVKMAIASCLDSARRKFIPKEAHKY